jgi:hypothetical protein
MSDLGDLANQLARTPGVDVFVVCRTLTPELRRYAERHPPVTFTTCADCGRDIVHSVAAPPAPVKVCDPCGAKRVAALPEGTTLTATLTALGDWERERRRDA